MKIESLQDLFASQIMDLYDAEQRLVKALPNMADAAASSQLRRAFESRLSETNGHVDRLEKVFQEAGKSPRGRINCRRQQDRALRDRRIRRGAILRRAFGAHWRGSPSQANARGRGESGCNPHRVGSHDQR